MGMDHTFACWGSRRKLGEYEFKVGHRLKERKFGKMFQQEIKRLEKDVRVEAKKCPACKKKVHKVL